MKVDLAGRVANMGLSHHRPLLPLFEAVINSFDAIRERKGRQGKIVVRVERGAAQQRSDGEEDLGPVSDFIIEDNGVGFTQDNQLSFETTDTGWKRARGGKGIGRLLWLKAFSRADVDSTYEEGGSWKRRRFVFSLPDGISDLEVSAAASDKPQTVVRLLGLKPAFQLHCPRDVNAIARDLMEHTLSRLLDAGCPRIKVQDKNESVDVNEMFRSEVGKEAQASSTSVKGHSLQVTTFRLRQSAGQRNRLHYCAHAREVRTEALADHLPDLGERLQTEDGPTAISCYVSGQVLDEHVNSERTGFTLQPDPLPLMPDELAMSDVRASAIAELRTHLGDDLEGLHKAKMEQIQNYITTRAPRYRHLLKADRSDLERIPSGLSDDKLESELHKLGYTVENNAIRAATDLLRHHKSAEDHPDYERRFREAVSAVSDVGRSKLADYVLHRKIVLDLLEVTLQRNPAGKYSLEEAVQELVFPLRATSNEVAYESQNLWVIDERLAYHAYLASDRPLETYEPVEVEGKRRPDLAVFGPAFATVDSGPPFSSVVIVEFKRPMRDGIVEEDNPIAQVFDYVRLIRAGRATDKNGRPVTVGQSTPFYCYLIADLSDTIKRHAENASLVLAPDSSGYFGYNVPAAAYIEVISYTKLLTDSKKRNRAFFERLHIPSD